ncbi:MAG TPA: hypothetical protein PKA63_08455 [Oligoflexia bacterium]|nr:hypothetical protein [Oligoflexia bacterium]HMP48681.1 hypothetical protein [Oligoflexia bacterium]
MLNYSDINTNLILYYRKFRARLVEKAVSSLTREGPPVHSSDAPDIEALKIELKPADVILVSGTARISFVVKALTLSPWSHVVMYVGDQSNLLTSKERTEWTNEYGIECLQHLVVDADPLRKVHLRPIDDYYNVMLRHCRPQALRKEDRGKVIQHAISQLGKTYDISHILRLMVFFAVPWELFPQGVRRFVSDFTLSEHDTICSRVIAEAFESVNYPIRPTYIQYGQGVLSKEALRFSKGFRHRGKSALLLLRGGKIKSAFERLTNERYLEIQLRGSRHVTPADYDLSRFFTVIKNKNDLQIDYWNAKVTCSISSDDSNKFKN